MKEIARMKTARVYGAALGLAFAMYHVSALAQTPSPLPEWEYSAGVPLRQYFQPQAPKWQVELGMGAATQPEYDGSSYYEVVPAPSFDVRYYNLAFLSIGEGLGVNIFHGKTYRAGVAITYDLGRKLNNDIRFTEQRKVGPTAEFKVFGEVVLFPVVVRLDIRQALNGGYQGYVGDLSVYMPVAGSRKYKYFVFAGPAVTFASGQYMQHYFGVDSQQAKESSFPLYQASGGLKQVSLGVNATWFFHKSWFLNSSAAVNRLLNDAAESPFTREKTQGAFNFTIGYLFGNAGI